ncbi:MAG TPA: hypothetical protein VF462_14585 [Micromonosporaceae bacterium]
MTVFPARRAVPTQRALPTASELPAHMAPPMLEAVRPSPLDWARRRRAERGARRVEAAGARALKVLDHLGPTWHIVDWPRAEPPDIVSTSPARPGGDERAGFLAIGPSGLFAVTVAEHGRARVLVAGDVVQINGRRPPYVVETRRDAKQASRSLSRVVGLPVPVTPVLAFVGSGLISVYGLPKNCLVAAHRELERILVAGGRRISPVTAEKLAAIARRPATWYDPSYRDGAAYRWYEGGQTATDKRATRR